MEVPVRELKAHLSHYLQIVQSGEALTVTSRNRPVARLEGLAAPPAGLPGIPAVCWAETPPRLSRPVAQRPHSQGEDLADWILANRR